MYGHFPLGQRTGFVKHNMPHAVQRLQCFSISKQQPVQRADSGAHHNGNGALQPSAQGQEMTSTVIACSAQRKTLPGQHPHDKGHKRDPHDNRHKTHRKCDPPA